MLDFTVEFVIQTQMKKKVIAVLLNLVLFPMGYYYLKSHRRFVALIPVSIFMYTIVSFVAWALPVHILENFHLAILVFLGLAFPVILVIDTLRQCSVPVPADDGPGWLRALYRRPHSYWIVPLYVVLVVTISWAYEPYERPFYHAYHITGMSMAPALQIGDFIWIDKTTGAKDLQDVLNNMNHKDVAEAINIERSVLRLLEGGCQLPLGVFAEKRKDAWTVHVSFATDKDEAAIISKYEAEGADGLAELIVSEIKSEA